MYENYSYEQLKSLPDDQKIEALKELKTIYPDNKTLAEHLDVAFIAVNNMVGKYLEGKTVGRKKMTDEEKLQKKAERKLKKELEQQEQQKEKEVKEEEKIVNQEIKNEETNVQNTSEEVQSNQVKSNSFSIKLEKDMTGEEAITRLNGVSNSLLKENQYRVSLVIVEV